MQTTISVRHCEISPELRARAETVTQRLSAKSPHVLESTVVFDTAPLSCLVELRVHLRGGQVAVAAADAIDHRTALDRAEDKIRPQIARRARRTTAARRTPRPIADKP
jgi:ribosome-associated translation inhibitor RaiA